MCPRSSAQIHTPVQAGGMTRALIRSIAAVSLSGLPSVSK
jgi:hypothetical protein